MVLDMTLPIFGLLGVECLAVIIASLAGYFVLRQAVRGLKALIAFLQVKMVDEAGLQRPSLSDRPGAA